MKVRRVLIIITTAFHPYGGLSTVMLNYYRAMKKEGLKIDFASTNEPEKVLLQELKHENSNYYNLGDRKKNLIGYTTALYNLMKHGKYDVIHVNGNSSTMLIELNLAKKIHVPTRIAHLHNIRTNHPVLNSILNPFLKKSYTHAIAVSDSAGKWLFQRGYLVLNNAIDVKHYQYDSEVRSNFRAKYNLNNKFVVGNVGKLNEQKNHSFLLKLFARFHADIDNSVLIIVGGGGLEDQLRSQAERLGILDSVIFMGMLDDVSEAIQGIDAFVFPSLFEGLGLALIEAQASGLKCIASDTVPKETAVSENVKYISLAEPMITWNDEIMAIYEADYDRQQISAEACASIKEHGYDISCEADKLADIYRGQFV